jgi:hypothetical protein
MPKNNRTSSVVATLVALAGGLLIAASAEAQCCMWCPNGASSDPLVREFSTVPRAQAGCNGDEIVWVQDKPRVYHRAGWPKFGKTPRGSFICKASLSRVHVPEANLLQRFL